MEKTFTRIGFSARLQSWLMLGFLSLIWGTSYILIKKALVVYSPVQVACLRLSISTLAFLPVFLRRAGRIERRQWGLLLAIGVTGTGLPSFLFPLAQTEVSSSVAGILNSLSPLFTLVLGMLFFRSAPPAVKLLGVLLGLAGAVSLIVFGDEVGLQGNLWYGLFIVAATLCYGTSNNLVGFYLRGMSSLTIGAISFFMVGVPALIYLLTGSGFLHVIRHEPGAWTALGYVALLSLFSTVLASILYFRLIQRTDPVFGSTVSYIVPAVALLWGVWDGEVISILHLLGMGMILLGVNLTRS